MSNERYFDDNRANWDDRAAWHEASGYGIAELVYDPGAISPEIAQDVDQLGDLSGLDVVHLQCHIGTDTVSLKRLGARRVVGVDLSPESLRRARSVAQRCVADVEFVEANVYAARAAIAGDFDWVYTSLGVLCWLPDVAAWGRVVASLLKPGGRFLIRDDHPMFMTLADDTGNGLRVELPYFQQARPQTWENDGSYVQAPDGTLRIANKRNHQWNHSLTETISALLDAGLVLDSCAETTTSAWCRWPHLMEETPQGWRLRQAPERLPLQFVLTAHKPA